MLVFDFQELSTCKLSVGTHVQVSSIEMILTDEQHLTYITNFVTVEKKREILSFDRIQSLQTHHSLNSFRLLFCNLFNCSAPKRITSLLDFHPQVKWNLFHYRKNVWWCTRLYLCAWGISNDNSEETALILLLIF